MLRHADAQRLLPPERPYPTPPSPAGSKPTPDSLEARVEAAAGAAPIPPRNTG